jgi:hypothetical protein
MTAPDQITDDVCLVKRNLVRQFSELLEPLLVDARCGRLSARESERQTWTLVISVGAMVLAAVWSCLCRHETESAIVAGGLSMSDVKPRTDENYIGKIHTTFGRIRFPWSAYRDPTGRTRNPARELFPHHPHIRSSELLLEWECALAADHPFRKAAEALLFFSHGAADVEDTTIQRHAVRVGNAIPVEWLYRKPEDIRDLLRDKATRDKATGKLIVYASTDAHALKRFVDETWDPKWKMTNGIRVWCVDKDTGKIHHLGGEHTWGDCHEVARRFAGLQTSGHLPIDGDYGDGVVATVALLTDGLDWIAEHVLVLFPTAVLVLDPYHVVEQVADTAAKVHAGSKRDAKHVVSQARKALGIRNRRGRTWYRKGPNRTLHKKRKSPSEGTGERLLDEVLLPLKKTAERGKKRLNTLIAYVERNLHRLHYGELRKRGFQIGSGAMESLHRTGSQVRLKRAGCRWTAEASQAILNLRMLSLSGRWEEYWNQPVLPHLSTFRTAT